MTAYPVIPDLNHLYEILRDTSSYKAEVGSAEIQSILDQVESYVLDAIKKIDRLPESDELARKEPNTYEEILMLRPASVTESLLKLTPDTYMDKLAGAIIGRFAGCILGAPVEFWSIDQMEHWARYNEEEFPPVNYWKKTSHPFEIRYTKGDFRQYTREYMDRVPVDDDINYTLLNLLILEKYGPDFTTDHVAKMWTDLVPMAYTAEEVALSNLKKGIPPLRAGSVDNPYCQWIGADIRSDAFAYICPGDPEKAASLAYKDAILSHRRNGIYGEMFFAASQSAAFCVEHPLDAVKLGLQEIPKDSLLAQDIRWALDTCPEVYDYRSARNLINTKFKGMSDAHTNNNACLTIFGLYLGGTDLTKVLSQTVAMGLDNDCTAATAGSIVGAITGKKNIPAHWYEPWNNTVDTFLIDSEAFRLDDIVKRFYDLGISGNSFS